MDRQSAVRTVLVVDDDPLVRSYMTVVWQELGWQVFAAANADLALDLVDENPGIDVALTEVSIPGTMDGVGLAQRLARTHPEIKVILTSGSSQEAPAGLPLLRKPWSLRELEPLLTVRALA